MKFFYLLYNMQKTFRTLISFFYLSLGFLATLPSLAHAKLQLDPEGHDNFVGELGLPDPYVQEMVVNFVKWVLGFLGLVSVIMIIYGGYRYLTAGGNEESVEKAKTVIKNAIIGLMIVLLSYAIALFVFTITQDEFKTIP